MRRRLSARASRRVRRALPVLVAVPGMLAGGGVAAQQTEASAERGAAVYEAWCAHCHDAVPEDAALESLPGVAQLELKYGGDRSPYIKQRSDLARFEVLEAFLRNGSGSMPPFRRTEISDDDIAAIAAFLAETSSE